MKLVAPTLACVLFVASMLGACQRSDRETEPMPVKPMPVVDVSALMKPGYWKVSGTVTMKALPSGKTRVYAPHTRTCITSVALKDLLNSDNTNNSLKKDFALLDPKVNYFFRGHHLQANLEFKVGKPEDSTIVVDWYFDDPDHAHEYAHARMKTRNGTLVSTTKLKYQRVTATCPENPGAKKIPAVDVSKLMNPGYWKTTGEIHETRDGKPVARSPDSSILDTCITAADLRDILNSGFTGMDLGQLGSPDTLKVTSSLHGANLHVVIQNSTNLHNRRLDSKTVRDTHFDDADHSHTTVHLHNSYINAGRKHSRSLALKMKSRRVSTTCPKETGTSQSIAGH